MCLEYSNMDMNKERKPLTSNDNKALTLPKETAVYKRRWYVLGVFCYAGLIGTTVLNTWGPVAETTKVLGWNDGNIALVTNLSNVSFFVMVIPACILIDRKGLRFLLIVCSVLFIVATGLRCITLESTPLLYLSYACAFISGTAAIVPIAGTSLISAVWFPPNQRTTATAVASTFNYFGFALSFLLGPLIVTNPKYRPCGQNQSSNYEFFSVERPNKQSNAHEQIIIFNETKQELNSLECDTSETRTVINMTALESGIKNLLFVHLGMTGLLFVLTLIYFPARPPKPPSFTASIERPDYRDAGVQLVKNRNLWLVVIAGGLPPGVLGCWAAILDVNLGPIGVKQTDAGWIGFWHLISGCISGLVTARFSDIFMRRRKSFLIALYILATANCIWFTLLYNNYLSFNFASVYASCLLLGAFIYPTVPLFYEISCEASYPISEGVTGGFYALMVKLFGTIFLFMLNIENIGVVWMNWAVLGSLLITIPVLIVFPDRFNRTDTDLKYSAI